MIFYKHESTQIRKIHPARRTVLIVHRLLWHPHSVRAEGLITHENPFGDSAVSEFRLITHGMEQGTRKRVESGWDFTRKKCQK